MTRKVRDKADQILSSGNRTDWTSKNVIEEQGRNRELRQIPTQSSLDDPVHTAADEHTTGLDVDRAHGIAEQHDRQHEPRSAFADDFFRITPHVISRRCEVRQDDGSSSPERDESQHHRRGDEDFYCRLLQVLHGSGFQEVNSLASPTASSASLLLMD